MKYLMLEIKEQKINQSVNILIYTYTIHVIGDCSTTGHHHYK